MPGDGMARKAADAAAKRQQDRQKIMKDLFGK
jgi:hypothetical protein